MTNPVPHRTPIDDVWQAHPPTSAEVSEDEEQVVRANRLLVQHMLPTPAPAVQRPNRFAPAEPDLLSLKKMSTSLHTSVHSPELQMFSS